MGVRRLTGVAISLGVLAALLLGFGMTLVVADATARVAAAEQITEDLRALRSEPGGSDISFGPDDQIIRSVVVGGVLSDGPVPELNVERDSEDRIYNVSFGSSYYGGAGGPWTPRMMFLPVFAGALVAIGAVLVAAERTSEVRRRARA